MFATKYEENIYYLLMRVLNCKLI